MTYAIGSIVYGLDLNPEEQGSPFARLGGLIHDLASEDEMIQTSYSGNGDSPYWIGADLGCIDETDKSVSGVRLVPTDEDKAAFEEARKALLDHLSASDEAGAKELAALVAAQAPEVFIAWGSS